MALQGVKPTEIVVGDCVEVMATMNPSSVDAIVTDPPYGLEFMGKAWDGPSNWQSGGGFSAPGIGERPTAWPSFSATSKFGATNPTCETCGGRARGKKRCACDEPAWKPIGKRRNSENEGLPDDMTGGGMQRHLSAMQDWHYRWAVEALRVAKPGAHLLAFGGDRTHHRLMVALEDAGWEIRTCIAWIFGSGFPKSRNVGKAMRAEFPADALCSCVPRLRETTEDSRVGCPSCLRSGDAQPQMVGGSVRASAPTPADALARTRVCRREDARASEPASTCADEANGPPPTADSALSGMPPLADCQVNGSTPCDRSSSKSRASVTDSHRTEPYRHNTPDLASACGKVDPSCYDGFGTALKPAWEIIIVARKPLAGTVANNVLRYGTGAINIDGCRVGYQDTADASANQFRPSRGDGSVVENAELPSRRGTWGEWQGGKGRWPANLIHDGSDEVLARFPQTGVSLGGNSQHVNRGVYGTYNAGLDGVDPGYGDSGSAARFFYCAKASRDDRGDGNTHPTVKPTALMRYLVRLVTPPDGLVLDPFMGSGSTGKAARLEGFRFLGIEQDAGYAKIAQMRVGEPNIDDGVPPLPQLGLPW